MPKQENHLHLYDRHAQPRDKEGAPRLPNFTKHPLQTLPIICKKTRCWQAETKELLQKWMNSKSDHLGQFPYRQYCLSCPCKLLLSHQSNKWGYTLCSAPLWGYCMIYQDDHKMSKKLWPYFLLSFNIHTIFRDTIVSVAPVAISQSQAVLLYTSLCDPCLSRFSEAATAIICFSNKCVIYIVFVAKKCTHICIMNFWVSFRTLSSRILW